jgi:3-oxoacyl-[acyl-carrier protein] reductase
MTIGRMNGAKRVLVLTGASGGIGTAITRRYLADGYRVVLIDRDEPSLDALGGDASRAMAVAADVTDAKAMRNVAATAIERFGGVHALVANAGIGPEGTIAETTEERWSSVLDVNLGGVFRTVQAFLPAMRQTSGSRSIVVTASVLGVRGARNMLAYGASKAGLIGFMQAAAQEVAADGITVNALAPGPIHTPLLDAIAGDTLQELVKQVPMQRLGTPDDVAEAAFFLSGVGASFITGQVLVIDGGLSGRAYWRDRQDR